MWGFPTHTAASEHGFTDYYNNIYVMGSSSTLALESEFDAAEHFWQPFTPIATLRTAFK